MGKNYYEILGKMIGLTSRDRQIGEIHIDRYIIGESNRSEIDKDRQRWADKIGLSLEERE